MNIKDIYESKLFEEDGVRKCWHELNIPYWQPNRGYCVKCKKSDYVSELSNPSPDWQFFGRCIEKLKEKGMEKKFALHLYNLERHLLMFKVLTDFPLFFKTLRLYLETIEKDFKL